MCRRIKGDADPRVAYPFAIEALASGEGLFGGQRLWLETFEGLLEELAAFDFMAPQRLELGRRQSVLCQSGIAHR